MECECSASIKCSHGNLHTFKNVKKEGKKKNVNLSLKQNLSSVTLQQSDVI